MYVKNEVLKKRFEDILRRYKMTHEKNLVDVDEVDAYCMEFIDAVVIFDSARCCREIETLKPDVYIKGGDYTVEKLDPDERKALMDCKAEIRFIPFVPGFSTTSLIEKANQKK